RHDPAVRPAPEADVSGARARAGARVRRRLGVAQRATAPAARRSERRPGERAVAAHAPALDRAASELEPSADLDPARQVRVRAVGWASLNGRPRQRLVDPGVDLVSESWSLTPKRWIVPLQSAS